MFRMETQRWAFEVYLRKGRLLLALSAVKRALAIGGKADPTAHVLVVRFALAAQQPQAADLPVEPHSQTSLIRNDVCCPSQPVPLVSKLPSMHIVEMIAFDDIQAPRDKITW